MKFSKDVRVIRGPHALLAFLIILLFACSLQAATVRVFYDKSVPQAAFAAAEISQALRSRGFEVVTGDLAQERGQATESCVYLLDQSDARLQGISGLQGRGAIGELAHEGFALRTIGRPTGTSCYVVGADAAGPVSADSAEPIRECPGQPTVHGLAGSVNDLSVDHRFPLGIAGLSVVHRRVPEPTWSGANRVWFS